MGSKRYYVGREQAWGPILWIGKGVGTTTNLCEAETFTRAEAVSVLRDPDIRDSVSARRTVGWKIVPAAEALASARLVVPLTQHWYDLVERTPQYAE
jgi:hypothetical protein